MDSNNENSIKKIVPYNDLKSSEEVEKLKLQIVSSNSENKHENNKVKKKRKILDEDEFVGQIENIIERDFFPDVAKMRLELEYQDAIEKNDYEKIAKISKEKIQQKNNENIDLSDNTPIHFDTPINKDRNRSQKTSSSSTSITENQSEESNKLTLNKFLNKFTSEDNDSFEKLQEQTLKMHKEKIEFLNNSQSNNEKVEESLALPSIEEQQTIKSGKCKENEAKKLITWKHSIKNSVMFDPEGVPFTEEELKQYKCHQVKIAHENTRFKTNPFDTSRLAVANALNTSNLGKIGVDGKEFNAKATPSVNGFSFVPSTPCFKPESLPNSPLMTWGNIEATPINLKGDATPLLHSSGGSHFTIPQVSEKELIGQELANRILSRKRNLNNDVNNATSLINGNQKSSLERLNSMSPAARLLATKKLGVHQHMDRSLQASYSPLMTSARTPTPRRIVTPSPFFSTVISTPKSNNKNANTKANTVNDQTLPKRPRADEFF